MRWLIVNFYKLISTLHNYSKIIETEEHQTIF